MRDDIRFESVGPWVLMRWPEMRHQLIKDCPGGDDHTALDTVMAADPAPLLFTDGDRAGWAACSTHRQIEQLRAAGFTGLALLRAELEDVLIRAGEATREIVQPLRLYDVVVRVLRADLLDRGHGDDPAK